jgi:hypothetical protein
VVAHRVAAEHVKSRFEGVPTHRSVTFLRLLNCLASDIFWSAKFDRQPGVIPTDPDILMSFDLSPFIHVTSFPTADIQDGCFPSPLPVVRSLAYLYCFDPIIEFSQTYHT